MENKYDLRSLEDQNNPQFIPDDTGYEYMTIDCRDDITGELFSERVWSNVRQEEQETLILELLHEIFHLVRTTIAKGIPICTERHPVDIGFCFCDGSPMCELFKEGYKVNDCLLDQWDELEKLNRLL